MPVRYLLLASPLLLLAQPVSADCIDEVSVLNQAITKMEIGEVGSDLGQREEEVDQVLREEEVTGNGRGENRGEPGPEELDEASNRLDEAREMYERGNENGCMGKVAEAKEILGLE